MQLTEDEAREFKRCSESVTHFARKYVWIKTIDGRKKWKPYPGATGDIDWQTKLLQLLQDGRNVVILKSRQVGASWTVAIFVAWLLHFRPNLEILLLSQSEKKAIKLLGKVKFISRNLPTFLQRERVADNNTQYSLCHKKLNGEIVSITSVDSLTTTGESGRGDTAKFVFLDELARLDKADDVWQSIKPTTSHGGQIVAASSPKGKAGPFARLWMQSEAGEIDFVPMRVHYTDCGFDQDWLRRASEGMTDAQINQEFELMFLGSGSPAFNPADVEACYFDKIPEEIEQLIRSSRKYATGVDSAEISRKSQTRIRDYNAIVSFNEFGVQVAAAHNQMLLDEWAGKTYDTGDSRIEVIGFVSKWHRQYPGTMFVEENGAGLTVLNRHVLPDDDFSEVHANRVTTKSKPRLVNQFALALAGRLVVITDKATYWQLLMYEDLGSGKYASPEGWHDDLALACLHAYDALKEMGGLEFKMPTRDISGVYGMPLTSGDFYNPDAVQLPSMDDFAPSDIDFSMVEGYADLDPRSYDIARP